MLVVVFVVTPGMVPLPPVVVQVMFQATWIVVGYLRFGWSLLVLVNRISQASGVSVGSERRVVVTRWGRRRPV